MKTTIAIVGLCVVFCGHALGQTNQIATNNPIAAAIKPKQFVMPDELTTRSGVTYRDIKLLTVSPNKINIRYFDDDGVMQLANITLADLPDDMQKAFGYDPQKAAIADAKEKADEKLFAPRAGMTSSELKNYYYTNTLERRQEQADQAALQAQLARQQWEDSLKERQIEAQERAATNSTQINVIQQQQQQQ
jgi:hypothetical protein